MVPVTSLLPLLVAARSAAAFAPVLTSPSLTSAAATPVGVRLPLHLALASGGTLTKVPEDDDAVVPFVDAAAGTFVDCYADSVATLDGITYTIGTPCDYAVALGYYDSDGGLVPVDLTDPLMDDVFPVAELIIEEEFGEELSLQRTPQTLTLVGELEEEDEEEDEDGVDGGGGLADDEEEVEILLSFEHKGREFDLVRLMDPVLLVGKEDPEGGGEDDFAGPRRILLTPQEADAVMPRLEKVFLENQEGLP